MKQNTEYEEEPREPSSGWITNLYDMGRVFQCIIKHVEIVRLMVRVFWVSNSSSVGLLICMRGHVNNKFESDMNQHHVRTIHPSHPLRNNQATSINFEALFYS